jgi:Spy/CpxP family protein refolding chaperone
VEGVSGQAESSQREKGKREEVGSFLNQFTQRPSGRFFIGSFRKVFFCWRKFVFPHLINTPNNYFVMKISSIIPVFGLAGATVFSAAAQDDPKPKRLQLQIVPRAAGGALLARPIALPRLQLDLTEEQKNKMSKIRKEQSQATREINQNKGLTLQDRRDQISDLRAEYQQKINDVYTPEQKVKLAKYTEERTKRFEQIRKLRIVLSDEQRAKLKKFSAKRQQASKAARELPLDERQATYQKISEQYQKDYQSILTKEQKENQKKLRELQGNRPNIRLLPAPGGVQPRKIQPLRIQPRQLKAQPKPLKKQPLKREK